MVCFAALSLSVGTFAIDGMLPTLHAIGAELLAGNPNAGHAVIAAFLIGVGCAQLVAGPVSDSVGRKPVFLASLIVFLLGSVLSACAGDFSVLLAARLLQGIGAGGQRVVVFSILRDRHHGVVLARMLSLVMTVLLVEPLVAPMLAQLVLLFASWRWVAAAVAAGACVVYLWSLLRFEETLAVAKRRPLSLAAQGAAYRTVLSHRAAMAAMVVLGLMSGAHLGFLTSSQSIFQGTFGAGLRYTLLLALVSLAMSAASLCNVKLVQRMGSAAPVRWSLAGMALINALALGAGLISPLGLPWFLVVQGCNMFAFGLLLPNLTAQAIDPFGPIAGTASSIYGFVVATLAAALAYGIGRLFDGSVHPLQFGYVALSVVSMGWLRAAARPQPG